MGERKQASIVQKGGGTGAIATRHIDRSQNTVEVIHHIDSATKEHARIWMAM